MNPVTFLALYRGPSLANAHLVTVTTNRGLIADFAGRLLEELDHEPDDDAVLDHMERGRRETLRLEKEEAARA